MGAIEKLEMLKTFEKVADSHLAVQLFYLSEKNEMEECMNIINNELFTSKERHAHRLMNKTEIKINKALIPFRTIIGTICNSKFSPEFLPFEEKDGEIAEIFQKLAIYEENQNDDQFQNAQMFQNAYILGRAYRLNYVGKDVEGNAQISSKVLNPFAVYFDPDSTDVITRKDAQFVDVVHWLSVNEIINTFPESEGKIDLQNKEDRNLCNYFMEYNKSVDRRHEDVFEYNGKYQVIERYYKVIKDGQEQLYLAVWTPELINDNTFLYNGIYHTQQKEPDTGKVMFPIIELVSDNIMGHSTGFVKYLKDPIKLISLLYMQIVEAARHSGTGYLVDRNAFETPEEADRFVLFGAHANQRYFVNPERMSGAVTPIGGLPPSQVNMQALVNAETYANELSSATPALQGRSESSSTAASLNAQRLEQSSVQLNTFFNYIKQYLKQTVKWRASSWQETYTEEMTFRIINPETNVPENITINQLQPVLGWNNQPIGEWQKLKDISTLRYDVVIADGFNSPSVIKKIQAAISELLQNPAISQNPDLGMFLAQTFFEVSDLPQSIKNKFKNQVQAQQQAQQLMMQQQSLQNLNIQGVA